MKKWMSLILAAMMVFSLTAAFAEAADSDLAYVLEKGALVVGITDFAPMDYMQDGEWIGFDADLAKAFAEYIGVKVEFVEIDWDNKLLELDNKSIDCIWNGMTLKPEITAATTCSNAWSSPFWTRATSCSKPYANNAQVIVVPADKADEYQTAEDAMNLQFAVEAGSAGQDQAEAYGFSYTPVNTQADALMEVKAGASDASIIDALMADAMIGEGTRYADLTYTAALTSEEYGVAFRQGSDLAELLNLFFAGAWQDGSMIELAATYGVSAAIIPQE